jgi:4-amino-4-deoxy-L-arabinose transferase-like glycosyltransferase
MELQHKFEDARICWLTAILISFVVMVVYLFAASRSTLWDRDEPRFTRATVEMLESGKYLVPTFNGQMWADKPILFYWMMSLPVRLLGPTEFACRFFAGLGTAISCLLTFFIALRLFNPRTALMAMVILASTLMMLGVGSLATIDAVLLPINLAVLAIFVQACFSGFTIFNITLMAIALGAAMLAKGPMGLSPVVVMVAAAWLLRKIKPGALRYIWLVGIAAVLGTFIFCAWAIPANNATGGDFLKVFIGRHILTRAIKPMENHGGQFLLYLPYYLPIVIFGFFPWTLHLPGTVSAIIGKRIGSPYARAILIAWIVPVFIIMSLAATKLPHYIVFIWPALAIAVAAAIDAENKNIFTVQDRKWLRGGVWFFGSVAVGAAIALLIAPRFLQAPELWLPALTCAAILIATIIFAVRHQLAERFHKSALVVLTGMILLYISYLFGFLPAFEQLKISPPIAKAVREKTPPQMPVAMYKYAEPSLNFYIGRQIEELRSANAVVEWAKQPLNGVLIIPKDRLTDIEKTSGPLALEQIASKKGFNYSKGKTLEVLALVRKQRN